MRSHGPGAVGVQDSASLVAEESENSSKITFALSFDVGVGVYRLIHGSIWACADKDSIRKLIRPAVDSADTGAKAAWYP